MNPEVEEEILVRLERIEMQLSKKDKPLNLVEAAGYLSMSQSYLYKLTSQRKIPCYKPNGKYLYFDREELDAWVKGKAQSAKSIGKL